MNENILKRLWLSEDESKIYLHLLKNPKISISEISKNLNLNRPKLYKILPNMEQSWLISKIIVWKRTNYIAENPEILKNYLENIKNDFDIFIPEIKKIYDNNFSKPILKNLKWLDWIKNIFLDIANSCEKWDIFYRYSSRVDIKNTSIPQKDFEKYKTLRNKKQLQRYVITNQYLENLKTKKLDKEVVIIPPKFDIFEDNITKIIYSNKVAIIDYNTLESFIIESEIFAHFEKKIFMLLFKFLKK